MRPSTRIVSTNRRERGGRRPDLTEYALRFAIALLSLLGRFGRHREAPRDRERLSVTQERLYREWARGEAKGV